MSADNTVLILKTADGFFRVVHTQNAEEIYNDYTDNVFFIEPDSSINTILSQVETYMESSSEKKQHLETMGDNLNPIAVYEFFQNSPVFYSRDLANNYAFKLYDDAGYVEYGIQTVNCNMTWKDIETVANEN